MENVAVVAIEHRSLIILIELFHAYCASNLLLWRSSLIHGLEDVVVRGCSKISEGLVTCFVVVVAVILLNILNEHLDTSHSKEEEYKEQPLQAYGEEDIGECQEHVRSHRAQELSAGLICETLFGSWCVEYDGTPHTEDYENEWVDEYGNDMPYEVLPETEEVSIVEPVEYEC